MLFEGREGINEHIKCRTYKSKRLAKYRVSYTPSIRQVCNSEISIILIISEPLLSHIVDPLFLLMQSPAWRDEEVNGADSQAVGKRIRVWWPEDKW